MLDLRPIDGGSAVESFHQTVSPTRRFHVSSSVYREFAIMYVERFDRTGLEISVYSEHLSGAL